MTDKQQVVGDVKLLDMIEMSEPGNAERLAFISEGKIHYVTTWDQWIVYNDDEGRWERDGKGVRIQTFGKMVGQSLFTMADNLKPSDSITNKKESERTSDENNEVGWHALHLMWARKTNSLAGIRTMVELARDLPGIGIRNDQLDADPNLLNVRNGTIDLLTGEFRAHNPMDLITKVAPVTFDRDATCPLWISCLNTWQPNRDDQRFLQSITGSAITGEAVQHLFINHGDGRNGKGTFYKHIQYILGKDEYATTVPKNMLIETKQDVHDEERAKLRGCRMLLAGETGAGDRLDEAEIKNLTGGDLLSARHLWGKPFTFTPTHTMFMHTNKEPSVRGTDAGIWSRVIRIEWNKFFAEGERDTSLDLKLELEYSGILNWLIAGCLDWKVHGLNMPPNIQRATEGYRADQDHVGIFLRDCFTDMVNEANTLEPLDYIPSVILRNHYEQWCKNEGISRSWSTRALGIELQRKGWATVRPVVNRVTIRAWSYPHASAEQLSDQDNNKSADAWTPETHLLHENKNLSDKSTGKENRESGVQASAASAPISTLLPYPYEKEHEEEHLRWLRSRGFHAPLTLAEFEEYEAHYAQEPEEDEPTWRARTGNW